MDKSKIIQIGLLVHDLDRTAAEWGKLFDVKPIFNLTDGYERTGTVFRGEPCYRRVRQAFINLDNVQIELISPYGNEPSAWQEGINKRGEGLRHVALKTEDMDAAVGELKEKGFRVMQSGRWEGKKAANIHILMLRKG